jgi:putative hydrolase of the HAD superfamily
MFDTPYAHTLEMIARVSETCQLFLLSDHCEIWAEHIIKKHRFLDSFEGVLWSYEIGATKKEEKPFAAILRKYNLAPHLCLFVDDNEINISIANSIGMKTVHFCGPESVENVYRAIKK